MILCVSFVSLCRIQALQGCFLSIRMQSTWCSRGISGFVAMEGTIFGGGQQARTSCITIQQISSVPNGLFPLLLGSAHLCRFSDGFGRGACCPLCLKRDGGGKGHWESGESVRVSARKRSWLDFTSYFMKYFLTMN